jgi:hypothetical protein
MQLASFCSRLFLILILFSLDSQLLESQTVTRAGAWVGAEGQILPFDSDQQIIEFLSTAQVMSSKVITKVARHRKVLLEKDGRRAYAIFRHRRGQEDFIFECAAYELSRLLGLEMVPPTVQRPIGGQEGSLQFWIEGAIGGGRVGLEGKGRRNKIEPPDEERWNTQMKVMRAFDNLIANGDRNSGNFLIDPEWNLWLIDHGLAFVDRAGTDPEKNNIGSIERGFWKKIKGLKDEVIREKLEKLLRPEEIEGLLKRRQQLVKQIQELIDEQGEDKVLLDYPALQNYDQEFYKANYNAGSTEEFLRYCQEVEQLVETKGWQLRTRFNKQGCDFGAGVLNAFGVHWVGPETFSFFFKLKKKETKQFDFPVTSYDKGWGRAIYLIDPEETKTNTFLPLFEFAHEKLTAG